MRSVICQLEMLQKFITKLLPLVSRLEGAIVLFLLLSRCILISLHFKKAIYFGTDDFQVHLHGYIVLAISSPL